MTATNSAGLVSSSPAWTSHRRAAAAGIDRPLGGWPGADAGPAEGVARPQQVRAVGGAQGEGERGHGRALPFGSRHGTEVRPRIVQEPLEPDRDLARPGQRRPSPLGAGEHGGGGELAGLRTAGEVLDGDDLGDPGTRRGPGAVHDEVDRLADEGVQRGERQVAVELTDEPQAGQGLAGRSGVQGRESLHARRQREQEGEGLTIADLADDGDVGRHPEEARHQTSEIDRGSVAAGRARLHRRHVRHRHVGLEHLLGDDDPELRIELGAAAGEHRRLARARGAGEHGRGPGPHAGREERGGRRIEHVALDELAQVLERHVGELADVDDGVAASTDVAVDDVEP